MERLDEIYDIIADLHNHIDEVSTPIKPYNVAPENTELEYPCIMYKIADIQPIYADNKVYNKYYKYELIIISTESVWPIVDWLIDNMKGRLIRPYTNDNLNHAICEIYY